MTCPRCGTENPANNRFCMKCGADMQAAAPADASGAGATAAGYSYTATPETGSSSAPGTQETYSSGSAPGTQEAYSSGSGSSNYNTAGANAYSAPPPPQFAPNPSSYGASPNAGMIDQSQLVGFWPRVGAYILDAIILGIVGFVIGLLLGILHLAGLANIVSIILGIGYFGYFWTQRNGQSIGMSALNIRVVREDGQPITWGTAIIRYIVLFIGFVVIFLGVLWVIWDPKKQGWHDKAAGTVVVRA